MTKAKADKAKNVHKAEVEPTIKAFLNSNPPFQGETLIDPHGKDYRMENRPFIEVNLHNFPAGRYEIELASPSLSARQETAVGPYEPGKSIYFTATGLAGLEEEKALVTVRGEELIVEEEFHLKAHEITGRALDKEGNPAFAYVWAARGRLVENEILSVTDGEGRFLIRVPEGRELNLFIGDNNYPSKTLEGWIMARDTLQDIAVPEIRIGDFEVYGLQAWYSASTWHIFFLPAKAGVELPPELDPEEIIVLVDGAAGEITSMTRHQVAGDYPSYILSVDAPWQPEQLQQVRVRVEGGEKGFGEAYFLAY